jgi:hypothetical protein
MKTNSYLNSLAVSSITTQVNNLTEKNDIFFISIFSPQNKEKLVETFNTICVSNPSSQLHTPSLEKSLNYSSSSVSLKSSSLIDLDKVSDKLLKLEPSYPHPLLFKTLHQFQSSNSYNTIFHLGNLEYTRNPLKLKDREAHVLNENNNNIRYSNMNLKVHDDEPFIKIQFEMQLKKQVDDNDNTDNQINKFKSLFKFNARINQLENDQSSVSGTLISDNKTVTVDYILHRGDEVPSNGGYDFEVFHNYDIQFGNFQVNSAYLINSFENSEIAT